MKVIWCGSGSALMLNMTGLSVVSNSPASTIASLQFTLAFPDQTNRSLSRSGVYATVAGADGFLIRAGWPNVSIAEASMINFFISYNQADRTWAEWIAWQLEEEGYTTVLQAWDFRPGGNFVHQMDGATIDAERTIAVLSPDYFASSFTQPEWAAAFKKDPTGEKGILLPVRVRECNIEGLLGQ